ncbi:MAG: DUF4292 domain-containing protein [Bacteroidaceae bacterium]|nr:DUF4292 domain-containing protein [Bacteroidaceae bacterium]
MKALRLIPLLFLLALVSCHTSRQAEQSLDKSAYSTEAAAAIYKQKVADNLVDTKTLTARIKMDVNAGLKDLSVNGTLRMKRDDVVQLSLTFLGMEVGRLEFTPTDVLIIDRFNKQYVRATYDQVGFLKKAGLDFYSLQALFWNELFLPGERTTKNALQRFSLSEEADYIRLHLSDAPQFDYKFRTLAQNARIDRIIVQDKQHPQRGTLVWDYADFKDFKGGAFPTSMTISLDRLTKKLGCTLHLSRIDDSSDWQTRTSLSSKYKQHTLDSILKRLMSL